MFQKTWPKIGAFRWLRRKQAGIYGNRAVLPEISEATISIWRKLFCFEKHNQLLDCCEKYLERFQLDSQKYKT